MLNKQEAELKLIEILPNDVKMLSNFFQLEGFKIFLVGGCIRDVLMEREPKDFDLCTDAKTDDIINILSKFNIQFKEQGKHFGVIAVTMEEGIYEIACFRTDVSGGTGNNTDDSVIIGCTMEEDVMRRDFTCNALFMDLQEKNIIDLVGGIQDMQNKIVRCVGDPEKRFQEDNLRKLRALTVSNKYGFDYEQKLFDFICDNPQLNISKERIYNEIIKGYKLAINKECFLTDLLMLNLIDSVLPNYKLCFTNYKIDSLLVFFASLLRKCDTSKLHQKLVLDLCFKNDFVKSIKFLIDLNNTLNLIGKPFNIVAFKKLQKTLSIDNSDIVNFCQLKTFAKKFITFEIDSNLPLELMKKGFKDKELGEKITEIEFKKFIAIKV
jgi:tRNA nucleotidyltransferase/poly(A) polymerase